MIACLSKAQPKRTVIIHLCLLSFKLLHFLIFLTSLSHIGLDDWWCDKFGSVCCKFTEHSGRDRESTVSFSSPPLPAPAVKSTHCYSRLGLIISCEIKAIVKVYKGFSWWELTVLWQSLCGEEDWASTSISFIIMPILWIKTVHHPTNLKRPLNYLLSFLHTRGVLANTPSLVPLGVCLCIDNVPGFESVDDNLSSMQPWMGHLVWGYNHNIVASMGGWDGSLPQACTCSLSAPLIDRHGTANLVHCA